MRKSFSYLIAVAIMLVLVSPVANAGGPYGHNRYGYNYPHSTHVYRHYNWAVPALVMGGIATAVVLSQQNQPQVVYQPVPQAPVYVERQPYCTQWRETQYVTGEIVRECTRY
jgi:hypothetical protein